MSQIFNAINSNDLHKINFLVINKEIDINEIDDFGNTPLIYAIYKKKNDIAKLLIKNNANTEIKNKHGQNALFYSILTDSIEIFNILTQVSHLKIEPDSLKIQ